MNPNNYVLKISNLGISFKTDEGMVRGVDNVSFTVSKGQTLGIVGESGSGKSVSMQSVLRLLPPNAQIDAQSSIILRNGGEPVEITKLKLNSKAVRQIRGGQISIIFQEPMASFSPVYTIGNQIIEAILQHRKVDKKEARQMAIDMLDRVGISRPSERVDQYPFELSGGMRQRAMIAAALCTNPALLIADEPTTALDVTIQAQILELMRQIQAEFDTAIIFITHDLGVIAQIADEISVMYLGRVMEHGSTRQIIKNPQHPYTRSLLEAIPRLDDLGQGELKAIAGDIPSPLARPTGCPFHTRCPKKMPGFCDMVEPKVTIVEENHTVSCLLYEEGIHA